MKSEIDHIFLLSISLQSENLFKKADLLVKISQNHKLLKKSGSDRRKNQIECVKRSF